jgi:hypothetical protein
MEYLKYYNKNIKTYIKHLISAPFIYSVFFWFIILDVLVEIYHRICFPLYDLPLVDRSKYIKFDRHRLTYLSWWDKFNCLYCSYWNGLLAYVTKIAAETEKYWCWIKHGQDTDFVEPDHHKDFLPYGDEKAFIEKYPTYTWKDKNDKCKLEG